MEARAPSRPFFFAATTYLPGWRPPGRQAPRGLPERRSVPPDTVRVTRWGPPVGVSP